MAFISIRAGIKKNCVLKNACMTDAAFNSAIGPFDIDVHYRYMKL
jgi:hypothetical protein